MENTLNRVIISFKQLISQYDKDSIERDYYEIIVKYLLLEHKYQETVLNCGKPIYHYFKYSLPIHSRDYFEWLYNPLNPVRFAIETFDSIEEIRVELGR